MRVEPELDPDVDDLAPLEPDVTRYDEAHFVTYMRLLDAETDGADWTEVARIGCIATQSLKPVERGHAGKAISPARSG